jgi:hypothetical protein
MIEFIPHRPHNVPISRGRTVLDSGVNIFAHVVSTMFALGLAGCIFVIPITACRLFSVLFQGDRPEEE